MTELATIFSVVERQVFTQALKNGLTPSFKKEFLRSHGIPGRLFNSARASVYGRIDARKESLLLQKATLDGLIAKAVRVIAKCEKRGEWNQVHQKNRRLVNLRQRYPRLTVMDCASGD